MMSNALCHALRAIAGISLLGPAARPATQPAAGHPLLYGIVAAGLCALTIWVVRRIAHPAKLSLRRTPGRANSLSPGHILLVLAAHLTPLVILEAFVEREPGYRLRLPVTMASQLICVLAALLVAKLTFRHGLLRGLGLSMRHWVCDTGRGVVGYLAVAPVCYGLYRLAGWFWPRDQGDLHELLVMLPQVGIAWKLAIVASAVALAPLAEEIFLRGLLQSMIRRYTGRAWLAIVLASAFFAALHTSYPKDMPALFALGIVLGYSYERCGRLWPSILMHALFNGFNIAVFLSELH